MGVSTVLFASGNYQVRWSDTALVVMSSPSLSELLVPLPPMTEERKTTITKDTSQSVETLGLTEEEEKELAELMGDDI